MTIELKPYRNYTSAKKAANGRPVLRVGNLYLVGDISSITSMEVILPNGGIRGNVTAYHLLRLGNANHATPGPTWAGAMTEVEMRAVFSMNAGQADSPQKRGWETAMGMRGYAGSPAQAEEK